VWTADSRRYGARFIGSDGVRTQPPNRSIRGLVSTAVTRRRFGLGARYPRLSPFTRLEDPFATPSKEVGTRCPTQPDSLIDQGLVLAGMIIREPCALGHLSGVARVGVVEYRI